LTPKTRAQSSSVTSSTLPNTNAAALFTRMSTPPKESMVRMTMSRTLTELEVSVWAETASPPSARMPSAHASPAFSSISAIITLAPSRAKRSAMALPMPAPAPVTIAALPPSFIMDSPRRQSVYLLRAMSNVQVQLNPSG
jgi:hypothetical protein